VTEEGTVWKFEEALQNPHLWTMGEQICLNE